MSHLDRKEVFTDIYARKVWGDGSGGGSVHSRPYIEFVNKAICQYKPKRILDIGCGDLVVASQFDLQGAEYIGWDAATFDVVSYRMRGPATVYMGIDALAEDFPEVDMILCKEVMQHLSNADAADLLWRMRTAEARAVIVCNSVVGEDVNADIETGGFRPINLLLEPFAEETTCVRFGPGGQYGIHVFEAHPDPQ